MAYFTVPWKHCCLLLLPLKLLPLPKLHPLSLKRRRTNNPPGVGGPLNALAAILTELSRGITWAVTWPVTTRGLGHSVTWQPWLLLLDDSVFLCAKAAHCWVKSYLFLHHNHFRGSWEDWEDRILKAKNRRMLKLPGLTGVVIFSTKVDSRWHPRYCGRQPLWYNPLPSALPTFRCGLIFHYFLWFRLRLMTKF